MKFIYLCYLNLAYISYDKLWRGEFYNNVSLKDKVQDENLNQLKLKVNDAYKKDEKISKNFTPSNDEDVVNIVCLGTKLLEIEGHIPFKARG